MHILPREQGCFRHPVRFYLWAFTSPVAESRNVPEPFSQREMLPSEERKTPGSLWFSSLTFIEAGDVLPGAQ